MPQGREYELKFSLAPDAAARLAAHEVLSEASASSHREHLVSTYYDTAVGALHRRRVTLRIRTSARRTVQTLKHSGASLVDRSEWECEGDGSPDLAWLRTTPLHGLFSDDAISKNLEARFTVDVDRTILPLAFAGAAIEGAIDIGSIRAGGVSLPIHEFELEHKDGPAEALVKLARTLARDLPLVLSLSSKAERGVAVSDASWGHPNKRITLDLAEIGTLGDLLTAVMQGCLHSLCCNAALIGGPEDSEAVHKTRIALRHIRAALTLFQPALRRGRLARFRRDLKWMSDRLGAARDGDVLKQLAEASADGTRLADVIEPRRRRARERLTSALQSARWRLLLIDVLAFSIEGMRRSRRPHKAAPFVRRRLRKLHHRLAGDARGLRRLPSEALHDVRKRAKMLRYDLDLVVDLPKLDIRRKHWRCAGRHLQTLQETLGDVHDIEALQARLQEGVLSRHVPLKGMTGAEWLPLVAIARDLCDRKANGAAMRKAAKAARRLRKTSL